MVWNFYKSSVVKYKTKLWISTEVSTFYLRSEELEDLVILFLLVPSLLQYFPGRKIKGFIWSSFGEYQDEIGSKKFISRNITTSFFDTT